MVDGQPSVWLTTMTLGFSGPMAPVSEPLASGLQSNHLSALSQLDSQLYSPIAGLRMIGAQSQCVHGMADSPNG